MSTGSGIGLAAGSIGVMQGRLAPPEDGRFQSFPRAAWREEFARAQAAGLAYIEWIHDAYGAAPRVDGSATWGGAPDPRWLREAGDARVYVGGANPIFSEMGLAAMDLLKAETGIATPALCGDWFMDFPLIRCTETEREERERHLHELIPIAKRIGAVKMVLPFVDQSRMTNEDEKQQMIGVLERALPVAERHGVELHLEADFGPAEFAEFLARIPHPMLKVNWDSGNSSGLGFVASEEFAAYGARVGSVHIKDRYRKPEGGIETRPLGTGSADFDDVFRAVKSIGYTGGFTLQVARGVPGDEVEFLKGQAEFVRGGLE
ncbi:hexulose-6-phosphate isomerase [Bryocella elongata]|uniref:Hexulose-6-phosphate isomerase n=1 Tax=Bryocella elongata TaxID=863522 RepID=A0A1H6BEW9_9BACT|nr:sugar phosphate isomerase/epimerase [Bryocella elongata]SEG59192.1 hexulose-6-phosphate isomerase [Bryocella elongata]